MLVRTTDKIVFCFTLLVALAVPAYNQSRTKEPPVSERTLKLKGNLAGSTMRDIQLPRSQRALDVSFGASYFGPNTSPEIAATILYANFQNQYDLGHRLGMRVLANGKPLEPESLISVVAPSTPTGYRLNFDFTASELRELSKASDLRFERYELTSGTFLDSFSLSREVIAEIRKFEKSVRLIKGKFRHPAAVHQPL